MRVPPSLSGHKIPHVESISDEHLVAFIARSACHSHSDLDLTQAKRTAWCMLSKNMKFYGTTQKEANYLSCSNQYKLVTVA